MFGIDHSSRPPDPACLRKANVKFVCRYLSTPGNQKNILKAETDELLLAGIAVVLVFETTARRALAGSAAGAVDASSARTQAALAGLPGAAIYFAVDFDATEADQAPINAYLKAAAAVLTRDKTGIYGGYWPVKRALDAHVCKYAWQTYAWSGGNWDPRAQLRQVKNGQPLCGIQVDFDESVHPDFGQSEPVRPGPGPSPIPDNSSAANPRRRLRAWIVRQRAHGVTWAVLKKTRQWRQWRRSGGK